MTDASLFFRLKEERQRLGLKQAGMAALAGISRETWTRYESGAMSPGMDVLAAIATHGADVQYILTGQRSAQALTRDEVELLEAFRAAPLAVKAAAIGALQGGSAPAKIKVTGDGNLTAGRDLRHSQGARHEEGTTSGRRKREPDSR